ncbi:MAG: DUF4349 domain-containing protein [Lachnospiraceae bacterium]|nr:DUF4349 domain-containing protein [Lachnospiraceae bacterium]
MKKSLLKRKGILALCLATSMMLACTGCGEAQETALVAYDSAMSFDGGMSMNSVEYKAESIQSPAMGGSSYADMEAMEMMEEAGAAQSPEMVDPSASGSQNTSAIADTNRKLIRTVNLNMETQEFDSLMLTLSEQINGLGGYVESMETYNGSKYSNKVSVRNAYMTVRIPKAKLDGFLDTISNVGNVTRRSENVQDVTLNYVDMESHKKVLEAEQERLLAFLEQATTVEEMIALEERLSNVRYEIESMEAQLRTYDNQVDYSTVHISIQEVKELTEIPEEEPGRLERLTEGFTDSLKDVGEGFLDFGIWVIVHIPYFVVWALVIGGIVGFIKLMIRRSRKKKEKKLAKLQAEAAKQEPVKK